tara:strand:- start:14213 stop:15481 length:1269 start_codon:yes stop_codon:yes gene_type:complete
MNSFEDLNTNINNYTTKELLNILELNDPSKEEIKEKINFLNNKYFKNNDKLFNFFKHVENKLLNDLFTQENNYIRNDILPVNNNIETNYSNNNSETENTSDDDSINEYNYFNENNENNLIPKDNNLIENYDIINFLHFNTIFRNNSINNIPSNCDFNLSSPINDITHIKLKSINLKMPYLISSEKNNNKFEINFYNNENSLIHNEIIIFDNGYYDNITSLSDYLNSNHFYNSETTNIYMKNIKFEINKNNNKSKFSIIDNSDIQIEYFEINFKNFYIEYYSLAYIMGFDKNINKFSSKNNIITSNYAVNLNNNNELFFCLDEFQSNIIETHKLFYKNNMSTNKVLAKIDTTSARLSNSNYISDLLEDEFTDNIRKYSGPINLNNFNIKIIDYFGNIINSNMQDDITFTLEIQINRNKLIETK